MVFAPNNFSALTITGTNGSITGSDAFGDIKFSGENITITCDSANNTVNFFPKGASSIDWVQVTTPTVNMVPNTGYIDNDQFATIYTLPLIASVGSLLSIVSNTVSSLPNFFWTLKQNAGQRIIIGNTFTTVGTDGSITEETPADVINLLCVVENTTWIVVSQMGSVNVM